MDIEQLRARARAVFLACEEPVAKDISKMLNDAASEIDQLKAKTEPVDEVPCSMGLCCRVRNEGETMRSGDIVLISDTFRPLGFHTEFYHYFAGLKVVDGMTGKIICKAT